MPTTQLLGITQVSASQNAKEVTINNAIDALEQATNAKLDVSFASGISVSLSDTQATRNFIFVANAATAPSTLVFPDEINGVSFNRIFAVRNASGHGLTVDVAGTPGNTVVIPDGQTRLLSIIDASGVIEAAEPSTTVNFLSLGDSPSTYAGQTGRFLSVNLNENALEFTDAAVFPALLGNAGRYLVVNQTETGVEWADLEITTAFINLTDTPTSYAGQGGRLAAVNPTEDGVVFIDAPEAEAVEFVAAQRWRLLMVEANDPQYGIGEIDFLDVDLISLIGTGVASASTQDIGREAQFAFDDNLDAGAGWQSEIGFVGDVWIEYDLGSVQTVRNVRVTPITQFPDFAPLRFTIQYFDGTNWVSVGQRTPEPWVSLEPQTFRVNGVPLTSITEAPIDGNQYARKDGNWEQVAATGTGLPAGGTTGQILAKQSNDDGAADWEDNVNGLPNGGTTGQVLTKTSETDGDAAWADPQGGTGGGGTGQIVTDVEPFQGALIGVSPPVNMGNGDEIAMPFANLSYDIGGFYNPIQNTRLTVPQGVSHVRLTTSISRDNQSGQLFVRLTKNGVADVIGMPIADTDTTGGDSVSLSSAVVPVVAGDYFEVLVFVAGSSTINTSSWFSIETVPNGSATGGNTSGQTNTSPIPIIVACGNEVTPVDALQSVTTFRLPYGFTLSGVRASLTDAQTSGNILTVDINHNGASILSTKLTIDNTEKTSTTAAIPAVLSRTSLDDDAEITIDIDQIGNGTAVGLKVTLIGTAT